MWITEANAAEEVGKQIMKTCTGTVAKAWANPKYISKILLRSQREPLRGLISTKTPQGILSTIPFWLFNAEAAFSEACREYPCASVPLIKPLRRGKSLCLCQAATTEAQLWTCG